MVLRVRVHDYAEPIVAELVAEVQAGSVAMRAVSRRAGRRRAGAGYAPAEPFGHYADEPESAHFGKDL